LAPVHCCYAIIPDGVPDVSSDPRRIGGGINTVPAFGLGAPPELWGRIALNSKEISQQSRVQIQFDDVGVKWLVTAYARLDSW